MEQYRHEQKYLVTDGQLALLNARLRGLAPLDPHAEPEGRYNIRSMYFDDYYNRCFYENENGTDPREKFRVRIYNHSAQRITLELKRKERGRTLKTSCPLTEGQCRLLMAGQPIPPEEGQHPLLQRLTAEMLEHGLRPIVLVEYDRVPFVSKNGNVRITFDTNVSSSPYVERFLDPIIPKRPVMPTGQQLLEVKYDAYLPDTIRQAVRLDSLYQTAYSKYYLCRKFSLRQHRTIPA